MNHISSFDQEPGNEEPELFRALFEEGPLGVFTYTEDGEVVAANNSLLEILGSPSLHATKQINVFTFENLVKSGISATLKTALDTGQARKIESRYTSKWNKSLHLSVLALPPASDRTGRKVGVAILQDISQLRRSQDLLRASEERFRLLVEHISLGIAILDEDERIVYMNSMFGGIFGCAPESVLNFEGWLRLTIRDPVLQRALREHVFSDSEAGLPRHFTLLSRKGRPKDVQIRVFLVHGARVIICEDNTELFSAIMGRRAFERRYLGLLENLTDFVYTLDENGIILNVNRAAARSLGYEPEEVVGRSIESVIPPDVRAQVSENVGKAFRDGYAEGTSKYLSKDGDVHYLEYRTTRVFDVNKPPYVVGIARDITERILIKRALKESEKKFKLIVETAHDGILYVGPSGRIQFCNQRMKNILKDPTPEGHLLSEYFDSPNRAILEERLEERSRGVSGTYFITLKDLDGMDHKLVVSGTPYFDERGCYLGAIGIFTDISELKKVEEQLQHSQKMEAIGALAGGIAHDFNNVLQGVLGYASLLRKYVKDGSHEAHCAEMIERSAEAGSLLSGRLLAFARKGKQVVKDVDVHRLLDEVLEILKRTLDKKIEVISRKHASLSTVAGDPGQIQQVIMNLCLNAKDAMPNGGRLTILTDTALVEGPIARTYDGLSEGLYIRVRIEDTGEGMSEHTKRRLFEPFYTTKEEGKGTGLGLSMVYGAIQNHGGAVKVYSELGRGSSFTVLLPLQSAQTPEIPVAVKSAPASEGGTVLLADDEEIVRELLAEMLKELGFEVIVAENGVEAVEIFKRRSGEIDLVLIDMVMPGLNGEEAFLEMKKVDPKVKAVLSTGFTREGAVQATLDLGIIGYIQKPYRLDELADALHNAMHTRM